MKEGLQTGGGGAVNWLDAQMTNTINPMIRWVLFISLVIDFIF